MSFQGFLAPVGAFPRARVAAAIFAIVFSLPLCACSAKPNFKIGYQEASLPEAEQFEMDHQGAPGTAMTKNAAFGGNSGSPSPHQSQTQGFNRLSTWSPPRGSPSQEEFGGSRTTSTTRRPSQGSPGSGGQSSGSGSRSGGEQSYESPSRGSSGPSQNVGGGQNKQPWQSPTTYSPKHEPRFGGPPSQGSNGGRGYPNQNDFDSRSGGYSSSNKGGNYERNYNSPSYGSSDSGRGAPNTGSKSGSNSQGKGQQYTQESYDNYGQGSSRYQQKRDADYFVNWGSMPDSDSGSGYWDDGASNFYGGSWGSPY